MVLTGAFQILFNTYLTAKRYALLNKLKYLTSPAKTHFNIQYTNIIAKKLNFATAYFVLIKCQPSFA